MAAASGISVPTLSKALKTLAVRGVVVARPGAGIRLADKARRDSSTPGARNPTRARHRRSDEVAQLLRASIFSGELLRQPGDSLSIKTVRNRYGVSYPVARDALQALDSAGLLCRYARGYRRRRHHVPTQPSTVALIVRTRTPASYFTLSPRMQRWLSLIQTESADTRIRLHIVPVSHRRNARLPAARDLVRRAMQQSDRTPLLGCIVLADGFDDHYLTSLVAALRAARTDTAVLGDMSDYPIARAHSVPGVRFFAPANDADAGRAVALALMEAGHRHVAFVTDAPSAAWSSLRFDAAQQTISGAGGELLLVAPRMQDAREPQRQDVNREARTLFAALDRGGAHCFADVHQQDIDELTHAVLAMSRRLQVRPFFERAIRKLVEAKKVTGLITAHDQLGLECAHLLRSLGAPPPAVSLASFDNSFAAALDRIASYDFNLSETVTRAIEWLLWPNRAPSSVEGTPPILYAQGFLADRASVGDGPWQV